MEVSEEYLQELLSSVFLWDVKGGTKYLLFICDVGTGADVAHYLRQHGYNACVSVDVFLMGVTQIKVERQ
jgi:hypothetical protein